MGDEAEDIEARVARGAAFMDEKWSGSGPEWWRRIDLPSLDMDHCHDCVFGQLIGEYHSVKRAFRLTTASATNLGFEFGPGHSEDDYIPLTAAWRRLILSRREAADAPAR